MPPWTGVALALTEPGSDGMGSRLSTYLHPVAGRPLVWHTVHALASVRPAPERIVVVSGPELIPEIFQNLGIDVRMVAREGRDAAGVVAAGEPEGGAFVLVDAAAPALGAGLPALASAEAEAVLHGNGGEPVAARVGPRGLAAVLHAGSIAGAAEGLEGERMEDAESFAVRDRAGLARAIGRVRDRVVMDLMAAGVTFLLPESVLVDVDVRIGRDTVIYPGSVIEGQTTIAEETVIGPCCRIVSSWIGRGAELKGFNYVANTTVRNRAILEAHVRRGFD